jgi:hypothetical protein
MRPSGNSTLAPCANFGFGLGMPVNAVRSASQAKPPSATKMRASGSSSSSLLNQGLQVSRSSVVGALAGGAHRTAASNRVLSNSWSSDELMLVGVLAKPTRWREAKSQLPDSSPVKTRPVLFPPCAAGANPTITICASAGPNPVTGLPQYSSSINARRFCTATSSRQDTKRGQARQTLTRASRIARVFDEAARSITSCALFATGVLTPSVCGRT